MALKLEATKNTKKREQQPLPKEGVRPARLVSVIDLGIQEREPWKGKEKPPIQQIRLEFDLVDDLHIFDEDKGEQPFRRSPWDLNVSIDSETGEPWKNSNLYDWWKALDPTNKFDLDFTKMLGQAIFLTVTYDDSDGITYANISNPSPVPDMPGFEVAKTPNALFYFDMDEGDLEKFNILPDFIKDKMRAAINFNMENAE